MKYVFEQCLKLTFCLKDSADIVCDVVNEIASRYQENTEQQVSFLNYESSWLLPIGCSNE